MPKLEYLAAQHGYTIHRVATAFRPDGKIYRFFLRDASGEIAADGRSFDERELRAWLEENEN